MNMRCFLIDAALVMLVLIFKFGRVAGSSSTGRRRIATKVTEKKMVSWDIERDLWGRGVSAVIGCDEAGRGCLAGPVVAAAVSISTNSIPIENARDSKTLTAIQREKVCEQMKADKTITWSYACVNHSVIDDINILQASLMAMKNAVDEVTETLIRGDMTYDDIYGVFDGNKCPTHLSISSRSLVKGDSLCYSVALASIVAKVHRDNLMVRRKIE